MSEQIPGQAGDDDGTRPDWAHLIFNPDYSDVVDIYEGGYFHSRGVFRSEPTSCMNNNIPYFSAIYRQAIVERIMQYAGEEFTLENFYAKDTDAFGANTFRFSKDGVSTEGLNIAEYYCSARCVREADKNTSTGNLDAYGFGVGDWETGEDDGGVAD